MDPSRYDLTIIGTPVRVQIVSSPVRADISRNRARFIRVAFFCAQDCSGAQSAFEEMRVSSGRDSVGALEILNEEAEDTSNGKKLSGLSRAS